MSAITGKMMPSHVDDIHTIRDGLPSHLQWDDRELALLRLAEGQARDLEALEVEIAQHGAKPALVASARMARLALTKIISGLDIPGSDKPAALHARRAAQARWRSHAPADRVG